MDFSDEQKRTMHELGKRRVYLYFFALSAVVFFNVIMMEGDMILHALDDIVIVAIAAIGVIIVAVQRNKRFLPQLKRLNNVLFIISVIFLIMTIYAVMVEAGDPADLGDDIPKIFISLALLINRFI